MNKIKMMAGVLALAMGLNMAACGGSAASGETIAVQSVSMLAGLGTVGLQNKYAGEVVAQATHEITKDNDRTVGEVLVSVGDEVKAGDVLFRYDINEIKFAVESAELELEKLQNTIESTKKQIEQMEKDKKKAPSSEQLSYSIEIQSLQADIKESEYNKKTKTSELERLKNTLSNTDVRSEWDGTVQSIREDGGSAQEFGGYSGGDSSDAYITIIETGTFRVKGKINEMNVADIGMMAGSPVIVRSRVDAARTWKGTLGEVDTTKTEQNANQYFDYGNSDSSTTSSKYAFYVELDESEGLLMGQHVYIELDHGQDEEKDGLFISSQFISREDKGDFVWAATAKDKLEKRKVELGEYNEELDTWEVLSGLTAEDYIAIPSEELREGLPVTRYDEAYFEQNAGEDFEGEFNGEMPMEGEFSEGGEMLPEGGEMLPEGGETAGEGDVIPEAEVIEEETEA